MITKNIRNSAWTYLGKIDLFLGYLASISLKPKASERFLFAWGIIRFIDEIIDSKLEYSKKLDTLNYYKERIDEIEKGHICYDDLKEVEKYIYHYFELERESSIKTVDDFKNIIHSFEMDINRTNKVFSWQEYNEYLFYRSESCMYLYHKLLLRCDEPWVYEMGRYFAHVFQYSDDVLDLYEDLSYGQINITKEELLELEIDYKNLNPESLKRFADHRQEIILEEFHNFNKIVQNNIKSFIMRRLLRFSAGYNISLILNNDFITKRVPYLPLRALIIRISKLRNQTRLYPFLHPILYLYTMPSWYDYKKLKVKTSQERLGEAKQMVPRHIFNDALHYLRNIDFFFSYLGVAALRGRNRELYTFFMAVIRYLDSIIDSPVDSSFKLESLQRIQSLVSEIQQGKVTLVDLDEEVERQLYYYLEIESMSPIKTLQSFFDVLESFRIDIERTNSVLMWDEYVSYLRLRSESGAAMYHRLLLDDDQPWINELGIHYARATQHNDDVTDLLEDIAVGQVNITSEEMAVLGISDFNSISHEQQIGFARLREKIVLESYERYMTIIHDKVHSYSMRRFMEAAIGYHVELIFDGQFMPGKSPHLPYKDQMKAVTNRRDQVTTVNLLHRALYLYTIPRWYNYKNFLHK